MTSNYVMKFVVEDGDSIDSIADKFDSVVRFFESVDHEFLPPLSDERWNVGIEERLLKSLEEGKIAILERNGQVTAAGA